MDTPYRTIEVKPLSGALGAEIEGVDIASGLGEEQFAEIHRAFADYSVILFRNQPITQEQHIAFARHWGDININRFFTGVAENPIIAEVRKEPDQETNIGRKWHTDHSYDTIPALGSILYACEVPEVGGDTMFSSMYRAYETLSPGLRRTLENLNALHSSRHVFGVRRDKSPDPSGRIGNPELATQDAIHPLIIRHPISGRKALYVNPVFTVQIEGWTKEESQPLLQYLYQHASHPDFTCRIRWEKDALAIWDNRATWHCALNDYQGQRRLMHRITVEGVPLKRCTTGHAQHNVSTAVH